MYVLISIICEKIDLIQQISLVNESVNNVYSKQFNGNYLWIIKFDRSDVEFNHQPTFCAIILIIWWDLDLCLSLFQHINIHRDSHPLLLIKQKKLNE
jgi:hypothetical protein